MFFFFKQKTAYEMRISDWSSDVCSSDLRTRYPGAELWAVFGAGRDKNVNTMTNRVAEDVDRVMVVQSSHFGSMGPADLAQVRSEERRVGKECVSTCRSRWSPYH